MVREDIKIGLILICRGENNEFVRIDGIDSNYMTLFTIEAFKYETKAFNLKIDRVLRQFDVASELVQTLYGT